MKSLEYMGFQIKEANAAAKAKGFRWYVNVSAAGARAEAQCPHFTQLPAAKAYIRENLKDEKPFNDDEGGASV